VAESELVGAVTQTRAPDGIDPTIARWVDATILRGKLEALLDEIRRRAS